MRKKNTHSPNAANAESGGFRVHDVTGRRDLTERKGTRRNRTHDNYTTPATPHVARPSDPEVEKSAVIQLLEPKPRIECSFPLAALAALVMEWKLPEELDPAIASTNQSDTSDELRNSQATTEPPNT